MLANEKLCITLRIKRDMKEKIFKNASELGISVNAYITMILSKELCKKN